MTRTILLVLAVSLMVSQSGCSLFAGSTKNITIASHPDADLYVDGMKVGKGSVATTVKRDQSHIIMAKLDSQTAMVSIGTKLSTTGVLDIVGGFLLFIPAWLGLLAPGAYNPDQEAIVLPLERSGEIKK